MYRNITIFCRGGLLVTSKRNKKKLNLSSKQANKITLTIIGIYLILVIINGIVNQKIIHDQSSYWCMLCTGGPLIIYITFYHFIFRGHDKELIEERNRIKTTTIPQLSYTDFRQVYFFLSSSGDAIAKIMQILRKEECKFYAKLNENDTIYLIVKDKYNEEVYSSEIENYTYFNSHFKFEKK